MGEVEDAQGSRGDRDGRFDRLHRDAGPECIGHADATAGEGHGDGAAAGALSGRLHHPRIAKLVEGFACLERSPRAIAALLGWTFAMAAARVCGTIAVAAALGLSHPVLAALVLDLT